MNQLINSTPIHMEKKFKTLSIYRNLNYVFHILGAKEMHASNIEVH
jgi:hypothetical protein